MHLRERLPAYDVVTDLDAIPLELRGLHPGTRSTWPGRGVRSSCRPVCGARAHCSGTGRGPELNPHTQAIVARLPPPLRRGPAEGRRVADRQGARRSIVQAAAGSFCCGSGSGRAGGSGALPELDDGGHDPQATPERRAGDVVAREAGFHAGHQRVELGPVGQHLDCGDAQAPMRDERGRPA